MSIKLIIYGAAGSGKDTQAARLSEALSIPSLSAGQIMRDEMASGTPLGEVIRPHFEAGTIVPNGVATQILRDRLLDPNVQETGYIVNGYPRSAESLQTYLAYDRPTAVIHLLVPDETLRQRLLARGRADDTAAAIETRIKRYHDIEQGAVDYVRNQTDIPLIEIDGTLPIEEVTRLILEKLDLHS